MLIDFRGHGGLTRYPLHGFVRIIDESSLTAHIDAATTDAVSVEVNGASAGGAIGQHACGQNVHEFITGSGVRRMSGKAAVSELFTGPEVAISR